MGELTGNKEDGVGKKIEDFDRSWRRNVRLPSTVNRSCYLGNFHAGRDRLGKRWESCAPEHVMSAPRELLSHASSKERYSPTASFFHPASRSRVMARRLLPLTVLTGIFAALGTGFSSCSSAETPSLLS